MKAHKKGGRSPSTRDRSPYGREVHTCLSAGTPS